MEQWVRSASRERGALRIAAGRAGAAGVVLAVRGPFPLRQPAVTTINRLLGQQAG